MARKMKSIRSSVVWIGALLWTGLTSSTDASIAKLDDLVDIPSWQTESRRGLVDQRSLQQVVGFADPQVCYPALSGADANGNGLVSAHEYVTFLKGMGPSGFLSGITSFSQLPLQLKSNFNFLVCLCQSSPHNSTCCVGTGVGIETAGSLSGQTPTSSEESYLFIVCSLTASAVERVLSSQPPSTEPSASPTPLPTASPTVSPSAAPSTGPTQARTASPSASPTRGPTAAPVSPAPTVTPFTPTVAPTPSPTQAPVTHLPTVAPTTTAPTTQAPSSAPTTAAPTPAPVPTAAPVPVEQTVSTVYQIGIKNGANRSTYEPHLVDAMDSLAPEVFATVLNSETRRLRQLHRHLQSLKLPTTIDKITSVDCPADIPLSDACANVTASVTLIFPLGKSQNANQTAQAFRKALNAAIARGELMTALNLVAPGGDVFIIDNTYKSNLQGGGGAPTSRTIGGGRITGIVVGSVAAFLLLGFFATRRQPPKEELQELGPAPKNLEQEVSAEPYDAEFAATLGATSPDYGKSQDAMMDNDEAMASMSLGSSSNAGSSGWSSSAGVSSLNTGSQDGLSTDGPITAFGSTLAALGIKAKTATKEPSSPSAVQNEPKVTRADLDSAIESGDWAAVGATAALLAAASDSQSYSSNSGLQSGTISRSEDSSSLDAVRAAELDHLVESGDWEGVVLAAAKYEAAETGTTGSDSRAVHSGASTNSSPSKAQRRQEIRAEVEELVRRVVPEEIQNVDEMMQQFRGREEELIETLRTMEERAVAQKARQGAQKQAKVQAKRKTTEERKADASALLSAIGGPGSPDSGTAGGSFDDGSVAATSRSLGSGQVSSVAKSLGKGQIEGTSKSKSLGTGGVAGAKTPPPRDQKQSALEEAIEKGDWEAVGEAAAMLSDRSLASSVETDELNRLADGLSSQGSDLGSSRGNLSDEAEALEKLIERGDWTGVVNAAAAKSDKKSSEKHKKEAEEEARRQKRSKHRKDEEEALAQAQIWEAIAEQTKQEDEQATSDQAASDAADWAIGRSLAALVQAEQGETTTPEGSSKGETHTDEEEEV